MSQNHHRTNPALRRFITAGVGAVTLFAGALGAGMPASAAPADPPGTFTEPQLDRPETQHR
jgi:sialidase-1